MKEKYIGNDITQFQYLKILQLGNVHELKTTIAKVIL